MILEPYVCVAKTSVKHQSSVLLCCLLPFPIYQFVTLKGCFNPETDYSFVWNALEKTLQYWIGNNQWWQQGLLCWPKHTQNFFFLPKYINKIITGHVISTWLHCFQCCISWYSFYSIIFQLVCVVRSYEICLRPSESTEQVPVCSKWTDTDLRQSATPRPARRSYAVLDMYASCDWISTHESLKSGTLKS